MQEKHYPPPPKLEIENQNKGIDDYIGYIIESHCPI